MPSLPPLYYWLFLHAPESVFSLLFALPTPPHSKVSPNLTDALQPPPFPLQILSPVPSYPISVPDVLSVHPHLFLSAPVLFLPPSLYQTPLFSASRDACIANFREPFSPYFISQHHVTQLTTPSCRSPILLALPPWLLPTSQLHLLLLGC